MRKDVVTIEIECKLDKKYFDRWDALSDELKEWWKDPDNYALCEGSGSIGLWCEDCPFCTKFDVDTE